jgi:CBS domain containing-hemolysin-like protein
LPALFLPELSPVFAAIDQMRQSRQTLALLNDEFGGFEGTISSTTSLTSFRISWEKSMILT